jgi:hypothetical protein
MAPHHQNELDQLLVNDEAARKLREEVESYPDNVKLIPMGLTRRDGKLGVSTALSCMCITDPESPDYGQLDMEARNPVGLWECNPRSEFPGNRRALFRSWAPLLIKGDNFGDLRTFINSLLMNTPWANGRKQDEPSTTEKSDEDAAVEAALADVGETE